MSFVLDDLGNDIDGVVSAANTLATDAHFGLVAFVDNEVLDTTGPLESGKVHLAGDTLKQAFSYYETNFTEPNRNPGDGLSGPTTQNPICEENAVDGLFAAASAFPWRPNATRVIIVATDDTFLDTPDNYGDKDHDGDWNDSSYPKEGNYPAKNSLSSTVDLLKQQQIRVFSFTRLTPPGDFDFNRCGTGRRLSWDKVSAGWSAPYNGAAPIPEATQGKNFDIEQVRSGALSLSETIKTVVVDSYCNPPIQ